MSYCGLIEKICYEVQEYDVSKVTVGNTPSCFRVRLFFRRPLTHHHFDAQAANSMIDFRMTFYV